VIKYRRQLAGSGSNLKFAIGLLVALGLSGCTLGPDYVRPQLSLPDAYRKADTASNEQAQTTQTATSFNKEWWTLFNDSQLDSLMQTALTDNADVQIAIARLSQAEAIARQAGAALYPTLNLGAGVTRASSGTVASTSGVAVSANTSQAAFSTSYELDIWGRVRRNIESATALLDASRYDQVGVSLTLSGLIANTYLRLRSLDAQISVLNDSVATRENSLRIAKAKFDGGLISPIDISQATAALASSQATLSEIRRQRGVVQNQLGVLTGKLDLVLDAGDVRKLPVPPLPPAGLPSSLLENRPDVNRAEQELRAANARVGVSTANLFPTISLTGLFGAQSVDFSAFLTNQSTVWSAGLGLVQPIFSGGLLQGRLDFAKAQQQELLGNYVKVVRTAFGEVSDALVSVRQTLTTEEYLKVQVQAAVKAQSLAILRYEAGYVDFLSVLESQRVSNEANLAYVINRSARLQSSVDLFKSLGGGWTRPDPAN
jgi:multidrug efflux system outer membrane protein